MERVLSAKKEPKQYSLTKRGKFGEEEFSTEMLSNRKKRFHLWNRLFGFTCPIHHAANHIANFIALFLQVVTDIFTTAA